MRTISDAAPNIAPPLASVLFGKSMQAILALLYGRPDEEFYLRELARAAGATPSSLQRDLAALSGVGIISRTERGSQVYFRANRACPIFGELRGLVIKTFGVVEILANALAPLAGRIVSAFVYGSVARGEEGVGSDIDLFVIGEVTFGDVVEALLPARGQLARDVNPTVFPRAEFIDQLSVRNHFLTTLLEEPKLYVMGGKDELESLARQRRTAKAQNIKERNRRPVRTGRSKPR